MLDTFRHYNRRSFLSKSLSGAVSLGLIGMTPKVLSANKPDDGKIIYRKLGKTGIQLPVVSMGVYATQASIIKAAYKAGVRYFSTADSYQGGLCEKAIGDATREPGIRDKVLIATKIPAGRRRNGTWVENPKEFFLERFSKSLERLQTEYVDILYLYNINSVEEILKPELHEMLAILKEQKKIRFTGFTTHSEIKTELLNRAAEMNFFDVVIVAFNCTMSEDKALIKALENAARKGIGLVAMKTQCGGAWGVDGYRKPKEQPKNQTAMLKWVLQHDFISTVIPAMETFDHIDEDFSVAYDLEYTPEERRFLDDENIPYSLAFCRQCQKCVVTCPECVDIPALMRTHMYAYQYQNMDLINLAQKETEAGRGLSKCKLCEKCQAVCLNSVPISERISELKRLNWDQYV